MTEIEQLVSKIRDNVNKPRKKHALLQNHASWMMLCSALDVIEDTDCGLEAFLTTDVNHFNDGNKYVYVYGTLQALFVQQDAVEHMAEAIKIPYTRESTLTEIRKIRNNSIGHPTKSDRQTPIAFNFISRITIGSQGFTLVTAYENGTKTRYKDVDIPDLIAKQRSILSGVLRDVIENLRKEEMEHRQRFADNKLANAFPPSLTYHLRKICEDIFPESGNAERGRINVDFILECIEQFKTGLTEREILGAYEGLTCNLELADYPLQELRKYFHSPGETHINEKDAYIFADFAKRQVQDLLESAKELDEEYGQDDTEENRST
jgi:hypothetical protein